MPTIVGGGYEVGSPMTLGYRLDYSDPELLKTLVQKDGVHWKLITDRTVRGFTILRYEDHSRRENGFRVFVLW